MVNARVRVISTVYKITYIGKFVEETTELTETRESNVCKLCDWIFEQTSELVTSTLIDGGLIKLFEKKYREARDKGMLNESVANIPRRSICYDYFFVF